MGKLVARAAAKEAKREAKKRALAASAIEALKCYGYANTTLRDIAAESDLSLGMLHYYFENKEQLLIYCVRLYKEAFAAEIGGRLAGITDRQAQIRALAGGLAASIIDDADTHRLWYDIRNQALFDPVFKPVVAEIEASLIDLVRPLAESPDDSAQISVLYGAIDGVFRHLLERHLSGVHSSADDLSQAFCNLLGATPPSAPPSPQG